MKLRKTWILITCLLLAPVCGFAMEEPNVNSKDVDEEKMPKVDLQKQAAAIAMIEKRGGKIERDIKSTNKPVIGIDGRGKLTNSDLAILKEFPQLRSLNLLLCGVTDEGLENIEGLTQLQQLVLRGTQVTDAGLVHLKGLTLLHTLDIYGLKVTDAGLEHLKGLTQLQMLVISDKEVTDAGLEHLKGFTKLKYLGLYNTQVTDSGLEKLQGFTELQWLFLCNTEVTDTGLKHLEVLTKLVAIDFGNTGVTDAGVEKLQKALPKCLIKHDSQAAPKAKTGPDKDLEKRVAKITAIKKFGGKVERDLKHPDQPVFAVRFRPSSKITDSDLAILIVSGKTVLTPLAYISVHVIQPPGIWLLFANSMGIRLPFVPSVMHEP